MGRENWTMASFALKMKSKCLNVAYNELSDPATAHLFNNVITYLQLSAYFIPSASNTALPSLSLLIPHHPPNFSLHMPSLRKPSMIPNLGWCSS